MTCLSRQVDFLSIAQCSQCVFNKREGNEKWHGPEKVVFQDGKVVFVRHGSVCVRFLPNRMCKVNPVERNEDRNTHDIVNNPQIVQRDSYCRGEKSKVLTGTETDSQIISNGIPI